MQTDNKKVNHTLYSQYILRKLFLSTAFIYQITYFNIKVTILSRLPFFSLMTEVPYHKETSPLIFRTNQKIRFYMIPVIRYERVKRHYSLAFYYTLPCNKRPSNEFGNLLQSSIRH